jgi:hypothetical protein
MLYLLSILVSSLLLAGFVALTRYETEHGVRYFGARRATLDEAVERIQFIVEHVDLAAFLREEVKRVVTIAGHAIVNVSLQAVRSVERVLTRLVRHLRTQHDTAAAPHESSREFVRTLSDFKDTLKTSYPAIPEVE